MNRKTVDLLVYSMIIPCFFSALLCSNAAITTLSEQFRQGSRHCIVIDPGHGGVDGGATSCTGQLESALNLELSLRLNDLFRFLGYDTKMIRTEDVSIYTKGETIAQKKISDLKERVRIVNQTEGSLLVSIHQNTFSDSRYHGAQVFYPSTPGSKDLADSLQGAFISCLKQGKSRKSKPCSGIYLMDHIQTTGVLIECGFLSNPEEEAKLRTPYYQKQLCGIIACCVSSFVSNT